MPPTQLFFLDNLHGWLYFQVYPGMFHCETVIYSTQDGGKTWDLVESSISLSQAAPLMGAYSLPYGPQVLSFRNRWVILAGTGSLYASYDSGATWDELALPPMQDTAGLVSPANDFSPVWFTSAVDGALIDNIYNPDDIYCPPCDSFQALPQKTYLYTTHNGGKNWQSFPAPALAGRLDFLNASTGWYLGATGDGKTGLFRTDDGGKTWEPIAPDAPLPLGTQLSFTSTKFGLAYNFYGSAQNQNKFDPRSNIAPYLFVTQDGGATWEAVKPVLK